MAGWVLVFVCGRGGGLSLDDAGTHFATGRPASLRRIMVRA